MLFWTVAALQKSPLEVGSGYAVLVGSGAFVAQGFSGGTDAHHRSGVELEFTDRNHMFPAALRWSLLALTVLVFPLGDLRITAAKAIVRDVTVDLLLMQVLHVGFVGEACVGGHDRAGLINIIGDAQLFIATLNGLQHRLYRVVFLAFTEGLGINDYLVFLSTVATPL